MKINKLTPGFWLSSMGVRFWKTKQHATPNGVESVSGKPDTYKGFNLQVFSLVFALCFDGRHAMPSTKKTSFWHLDFDIWHYSSFILDNAISIYYINLSMQKAYQSLIFPLFYMSTTISSIKFFPTWKIHLGNLFADSVLFCGFPIMINHRENAFPPWIIHLGNAFIVGILGL